jgi:uncharacterized protein YbjT (DUF2867 family)
MKIIVTGSLGHIGKPLTIGLVKRGHQVTVISSKPERKKDIEALGASAAIGSIEDVDFLTSVFKGADVIHAMIPPDITAPDPMAWSIRAGNCLVKAIDQSGVKRVVYVSSYGAQLDKGTGLIVGHHRIENALDNLNLESLTLLRATYIYYNLYVYVGMIKSAGMIAANYGDDDMVVLVSPADIAAAAVEELESKTKGRKVSYVASDERTCNEIAALLGKAIGKPDLKWVTISNEEMQAGMEAHGLSAPVAANMTEMFEACHTGLLNEDYFLHKPKILGKIKTEDFAKEFAAVYSKQ